MTVICKFCNKEFKSYQSRCNHYRKYHKDENDNSTHKVINVTINDDKRDVKNDNNMISGNHLVNIDDYQENKIDDKPNNLICKFCNKEFSYRQTRWRHEKSCNGNDNDYLLTLQKENEILKKELSNYKTKLEEDYKIKIENLNKKYEEIKELINKKPRGRPKKDSNNVINSNNTNSNNTTNNIQNNYNIVHLGNENLTEVFTKDEKLSILNGRYMALNDLIEYTHFNDKYPQYKNFYISNHKSDTAHKYDRRLKKFILVNKDELIKELINNRACDINDFFDELGNELTEKTREKTADLINKLDKDIKFMDKKEKQLKLEIFNLSDNK